MSDRYKINRPGSQTAQRGPGFPGNTQSSQAQDPAIPAKVNEGDPCSTYVSMPIGDGNSMDLGPSVTIESVQGPGPDRGGRGMSSGY